MVSNSAISYSSTTKHMKRLFYTIKGTRHKQRASCISDHTNWTHHVPLICNALNQTLHYNRVSRNNLYYNPLLFQNSLNLSGLIFPEHIFTSNQEQLDQISQIRGDNLKKEGKLPKEWVILSPIMRFLTALRVWAKKLPLGFPIYTELSGLRNSMLVSWIL